MAPSDRNSSSNNADSFETRLGDYQLGQILGAGEFGKVRLGWRVKQSTHQQAPQVAIKIIKRSKLDSESRIKKVYREIDILRQLDHPNIVSLHQTVETDEHIGIVLEYASGGELFDYILTHRYLKDPSARRLFAQLISGVGYLHKKGIIHRDLKLENLLLDRNKNIIITDFGFANTFNPVDRLSDEIERHLNDKEWLKSRRLYPVEGQHTRRADLMATSCGSPCYAAPELVVRDGLYHGRKVDVWSCGVILYAMLAGYLPFDDDPNNPEGDNINALYNYITTTELIFPDYVTPHARDLLRRILVPNPERRADLFEVARHSWLSEFSTILDTITGSHETPVEPLKLPAGVDGHAPPSLDRSASIRAPGSSPSAPINNTRSGGQLASEEPTPRTSHTREERDAKRRTVQLEYVPPQTSTSRTSARDSLAFPAASSAKPDTADERPVPPAKDHPAQTRSRNTNGQRPGREPPRAISDSTAFTQTARPSTGGSLGRARLPSRGSYGQPSVATVATTNAQGLVSVPRSSGGKSYQMSDPVSRSGDMPTHGASGAQPSMAQRQPLSSANHPARGHKRSTTLGGIGEKILGRTASISKRGSKQKPERAYPPTSMKPMPNNASLQGSSQQQQFTRASIDSKRSGNFGGQDSLDGSGEGYAASSNRTSRRMSWFEKIKPKQSREHDASVPHAQGPPSSWNQSYNSSFNAHSVESQPSQSRLRRSLSKLRESFDGAMGRQPSREVSRSSPPMDVSQPQSGEFKPHRRFAEEYEKPKQHSTGGSSGAARRVMDYFRRRKQGSGQAGYWEE